ncbi:MAG TPA: MBL fold metallo-hydrolase [Candidatus Xenobia bacterium]|jgi:glyoxylase-like metal-dependent hydrolase (beta-lactamase superfamily II)
MQKVNDRLYRMAFLSPFPTNIYFVVEPDGLTVIDSGYDWTVPLILRAAGRLGKPVRRVLLTHAHPDHAGGAMRLARTCGAEILAHAADVPFLTGQRSMADEAGGWLCRTVLGGLRVLGLLDTPPCRDVTPLSEGDMVGRLQVLFTPGHTPGSASFWAEADEAIFCGDNASATFFFLHLGVPWFSLDMGRLYQSVGRYRELPARHLLCGHGPVWHGDLSAAMGRLLA